MHHNDFMRLFTWITQIVARGRKPSPQTHTLVAAMGSGWVYKTEPQPIHRPETRRHLFPTRQPSSLRDSRSPVRQTETPAPATAPKTPNETSPDPANPPSSAKPGAFSNKGDPWRPEAMVIVSVSRGSPCFVWRRAASAPWGNNKTSQAGLG